MMVVYTIVGFVVVWSILGSLLVAGAASFLNFWRSLTPTPEQLRVSQVDLEIQQARRRMVAETLRQSEGTSETSNGFRPGSAR